MSSIQHCFLDPGKVTSLLERLGFLHESSPIPTSIKEPSPKNMAIVRTASDNKPKPIPKKECPHCHELIYSPSSRRHTNKCIQNPQVKEANHNLDLIIEDSEMSERSKDNCGKCELDNGYGAMICCC